MKTSPYTALCLLSILQLTAFSANAEIASIYGAWQNDKLTLTIGENYCIKWPKREASRPIMCATTDDTMIPIFSREKKEYRVVKDDDSLLVSNNEKDQPFKRIMTSAEAKVVLDINFAIHEKDKEMFSAILKHTKRINNSTYLCRSIVDFALGWSLSDAITRAGEIGCLDALSKKFLHNSRKTGIKKLRWLLEAGVSVDTTDRDGKTLLLRSVSGYGIDFGMVQFLLEYNPDLTAQNKWGRSVIQEAEHALNTPYYADRPKQRDRIRKIVDALNEYKAFSHE